MITLPITHPEVGGLQLANIDIANPLTVIQAQAQGQRIGFFDEGWYSVLADRGMLPDARQILLENGCEEAGYVNILQIPRNTDLTYKPTYHRMRLECDRLNAWLRRTNGEKIVGWGADTAYDADDWFVWDVTHDQFRAFAGKEILAFRRKYGISRIIGDEGHAGLWSLTKGATDAEKAADRATIPVTNEAWHTDVWDLARRMGGGEVTNGTQGLVSEEEMRKDPDQDPFQFLGSACGVFCQFAVSGGLEGVTATIRKCIAAANGIPEYGRIIVLQDDYQRDGGRFLVALAACLRGVAQQSTRNFRSTWNPNPFVRGAWGRHVKLTWDRAKAVLVGEFENATITLDLVARTVSEAA